MFDRGSFAYAQARLQAHHGRRPTKSTWQYLNASKSLGHYLDSARQTGLKRWVAHFSATTDIHVMEEALRREWRAYVATVAMWMPRAWRPAVQWTSGLVDLPMTAHLARGETVPPWAGRDQEGTLLTQINDQDWAARQTPLVVWSDHFRTVLPASASSSGDGIVLENLIQVLRRDHGPDHPANTLDGVEFRYQLISHMERLFRRYAQRPVAVFAFLAMVAMDLEHLRAHLIHRCLFPETLDTR